MNAYQELANAIIARAVDDVVEWKLEEDEIHPRQRGTYFSLKGKDAKRALAFLHDESRTCMYTKYKAKDFDEMIERKYQMIKSGERSML